jgi:hypothetical protein
MEYSIHTAPMRIIIETRIGSKLYWFTSDGSYADLVNMANGINCFAYFHYECHPKARILIRKNGKYVIAKAISAKTKKKSQITDDDIATIVDVFKRNI